MDDICKALLSDEAGLVELDTIGGLNDTDVRGELWNFSCSKMAVLFTRVVTSVENPDTSNINHEHGSAQNMTSSVAPKANTIHFKCLVEVNDLETRWIILQNCFYFIKSFKKVMSRYRHLK